MTAQQRGGSVSATSTCGLSTSQAAQRAGVTRGGIKSAIKKGYLLAVQVPGMRGAEYRIDAAELERWQASAVRRKQAHQAWTEADECALLELMVTCSNQQIAEYLGRPIRSIKMKRHDLRRRGIITGPRQWRRSSPMVIPQSGILLAKTCVRCGQVRDGAYYDRVRSGATKYRADCRICHGKNDPRRNEYPSRENLDLLQELTYAQASNEGQRYTEDELLILGDRDQSELDVALKLQRSYYAVCSKRYKMGIRSDRPKRSRESLPDSAWRINIPKAIAAARDYFRAAGLTAPEALHGEWPDWRDGERVAS